MISLFQKLDTPIIHIRRLNILETLVSEARARQSGLWHIKAEAEQPPTAISLNTRALLAKLEERAEEMLLVQKWLVSSLRQAISNYEAVAELLAGTDFGKFLPGNEPVPDVV